MTRLDCADSRADMRSAALACAAARSLSMVRRIRPQTSISRSAYMFQAADQATDGRGRDGAAAAGCRPAVLGRRARIAERRIEPGLALADQRNGTAVGRFRDLDSGWKHRPGRRVGRAPDRRTCSTTCRDRSRRAEWPGGSNCSLVSLNWGVGAVAGCGRSAGRGLRGNHGQQ